MQRPSLRSTARISIETVAVVVAVEEVIALLTATPTATLAACLELVQ